MTPRRHAPPSAWWLRIIALAVAALAATWAWWWWQRDHAVVAVVGAAMLVLLPTCVLALDFAFMHLLNRRDAAPRASVGDLVHAWWAEARAGLDVFAWQQPWRWNSQPDHLPAASRGRRGVVLVHGFMCNRALWNGWMPRLRAHGVPHVAIDLGSAFGDIDGCTTPIDEAVRRLREATGLAPVIVAHSMGGLAARAWLRDASKMPAPEQATREVHALVTIGSPHHGTAVGHRGPMSNVSQMRSNSPWLGELTRGESPAGRQHFVCFYSHCDEIVFPASTAALEGADNRHVRAVGHMRLIDQPDVFDAVLHAVRGGATHDAPKEKAAHEARPEFP